MKKILSYFVIIALLISICNSCNFYRSGFFQKLIDKILEFQIAFTEKIFSSAKGKIDFFRIGDDFGTQRGLLFDLKTFTE